VITERLSPLDTAFLSLDDETAPMHMGALAVFHPQRPVTPARLAAVLCERADRLPWLRRRLRPAWSPLDPGSWVEDRRFHVRRHIHLHQLDDPDDGAAVLAAKLMAEPLDLGRPLWQLHVLTGLPGARFALLVKVHHAMADGLRAVELGMSLLDGFADRCPAEDDAPATSRRSVRDTTGATSGWAGRPAQLVTGLTRVVTSLSTAATEATDAVGIASSVLSCTRIGGTASPLRTREPAGRRLALLRLDLTDIRQVRHRHGGTDNDVLLAVLTGALREWLDGRGQSPDVIDVRALIPVSRRSRPHEGRHGNLLSGYLCQLPVHERDPLTRLREIRTTMDRNKAAGPCRGAGAIPVLADRLPAVVHRVATPLLRRSAGRLFDTVVTNVPMPALPLTLDGAVLREVYPITPLAHGHALGIALSAYQGTVHIGLHADHRAVPDLQRIADAIPTALADLADCRGAG
jgi:diacylglycerol O-acyltransferase / wax synthase